MDAKKIKDLLKTHGVKVKDIADSENVSLPAVSLVIHGGPSKRLRKAIAAAIKLPVDEVFPCQQP